MGAFWLFFNEIYYFLMCLGNFKVNLDIFCVFGYVFDVFGYFFDVFGYFVCVFYLKYKGIK